MGACMDRTWTDRSNSNTDCSCLENLDEIKYYKNYKFVKVRCVRVGEDRPTHVHDGCMAESVGRIDKP